MYEPVLKELDDLEKSLGPAVWEELRIIQSELREHLDVELGLQEIASWSIKDRAYAEQWALTKQGDVPPVLVPFVK